MDIHRDTTSSKPTLHHRRPSAHQSVSLRHDQANSPSTTSPKLNFTKQSSGESSDASHWYEKTNNNALQRTSFLDNDPPFNLRNDSSLWTPPEGIEYCPAYMYPNPSTPNPSGNPRGDTDDGGSQEFRSVIDDLTIANKKLRKRLRKYETFYDAHLQDEKLFEVRFYALSDDKKKELEDHLRKFVADLDSAAPTNTGYPQISYAPPLAPHQSTHSHTSRFAESGYASMSASGQNSIGLSQDNDRRKLSKSQYNQQQQQNIHSYLHDIPAGLLPGRNAPMTDKSKKKLVVRRLEQIFAGKSSVPGSHPQPVQQEEVAQSAAMADRREKEAIGQQSRLEGLREARIMHSHFVDDENIPFAQSEVPRLSSTPFVNNHELAGPVSPDQRPTRPLDLDPYRAQVPSDNFQYIRHLGFTPPGMISGEAPEEGHGWLYLNLLINMAQLHTINVTPDFVKDAVSEFSHQFELSPDGRKIRWRGDQHSTMANSDSSPEQLGDLPFGVSGGPNPVSSANRLKTGSGGDSGELVLECERRATKKREQDRFAYEPLFFHKDDTDDEDDYYDPDMSSSNNSTFHAPLRGDSPGLTSSPMRSSSSLNRSNYGPIIFYNKAKFCTDLSGDRRGLSSEHVPTYQDAAVQPLGASPHAQASTHLNTSISEPRGPLNNAAMEMDMKEGEKTSSGEDFQFSPESLRKDSSSSESLDIVEFEASGLGGIQPDDNFAIKVRRSQVQMAPSPTARARRHKSYGYSEKILAALKEQPLLEGEHPRKQPNVIKTEIISTSRKNLPSSALPPASYLSLNSPSDYGEDSDSGSDISSGPLGPSFEEEIGAHVPSPTLRLVNLAFPTRTSPSYAVVDPPSESTSSGDEHEDDSDDGSVDFLATARKLDPTSILAREREYDAAVADRLVEDIPAGSSAATNAGGSGFNTPEGLGGMAVIEEDVEIVDSITDVYGDSSTCRAESERPSLKRPRTDDSMAALLQRQKLSKKN
ncbi:hypothetical protein K504DRAFT_489392 [Pleomassaria siparia CBS 279.74]|uniref:Frequency clock protein n=1 Tax=Pleomassaria siparia CBS 279.74 TaxID=1314801 RepID=A0A6G1KGC9_9PLEO|nr:hypothetical protein K504DRAFT_489392 [Pleomassaria siparia CBS 279.74]